MKEKTAFRSIILIVGALVIVPAARANEPTPEWILIPIVASHARDATGAVWSSTVFFDYTALAVALPVSNEPVLDYRELQPGERGVLDFHTDELKVGPGVIILTLAFVSKQLYIQSYVYNEARPGVGVSIPGIRLSDLQLGPPVRLVGIPMNSESRTLVRIYGFTTGGADCDVLVRVFDATGHILAVDTVHLFSTPLLPRHADATQPAYGEYRPAIDPAKYPSISIDFESLTPPSPSVVVKGIWAFSTTTGAKSENVTAVFPAQ